MALVDDTLPPNPFQPTATLLPADKVSFLFSGRLFACKYQAESNACTLPKPENAPEHCPGTESLDAGRAAACAGCPNQDACQTAPKGPDPDLPLVKKRMETVKRKILVLSGKGGVGKSTFTTALAWAFAADEDLQVCSFRCSDRGDKDSIADDFICSFRHRLESWMQILLARLYP